MTLNSLMIRASAGSGKTFQLSNRVLALLAAGAEPSEVIALTFTRKAAGEFADRILSRLAKGALDEASAAELARSLAGTLQGDAATRMPGLLDGSREVPLDLPRIRELLEKLVAELHRVSLTTLDSFFVRIAKRFPYELGIGQLSLMEQDELEAQRKRVMGRIFRDVTEAQRKAFLYAFQLATFGKEQLRLSELLDEFLAAHHQRFVANPGREAWGSVDFLWPNGCPWLEVDDFAAAANAVRALLESVVVEQGRPDNRWIKGWETTLDWFAAYEPGTGAKMPSMAGNFLERLDELQRRGETVHTYYKKDHVVGGRLAGAIKRLIGGYLRAEIEVKATQTQGIWAMLWAYETIYAKEVRKLGMLGFADVTRLLAEHSNLNIESRLDARYKQWLLDEFQDTSREQAKVLEGMLDEAVMDAEGGRSIFVVGDTKQGIYGWRGGEPRLFDDLMERPGWSLRLKEWGMQTSWRSAQEVLDLANDVCDPGASPMRDRFPAAALKRWKYEPHRAAPRPTPLVGYTCVIDTDVAETDDSDDGEETISGTDQALCDLLGEVQPVRRGLSCVVLVQSNRKASAIVNLLRREFPGLPVEMDAEVKIAADHPLGVAVLDWCRWLAHPQDELAIGHVERSPLGSVLAAYGADRASRWHGCRLKIRKEGIAALLAEAFARLRAQAGLNDFLTSRMAAIERAAFDYDESGRCDLDEWIARLESLTLREYSSTGAIQVMTLHKAKGLEFDMVVLPDLGGFAFDDVSKASMLEFKDAHGLVNGMLLPPRKDLLLADPQLRALFESWAAEQCYERFCNFYVALTRAKHATYVLLPKASTEDPDQPKRRYDMWLRAVVGDDTTQVQWAGNEWHALRERGKRDWFRDRTPTAVQEAPRPEAPVLGGAVARRARTTPTLLKQNTARASSHSAQGMAFGNAVHAAFESIGWVDEVAPVFHDDDAGRLVREVLAVPSVCEWFEKRGRNIEVLTEQPIEAIVDEVWLSGAIDRLHLYRDPAGQVAAIEIIDFKTDVVGSAGELWRRYAAQMSAYQRVLAGAYPKAKIRAVLVSTHLKRVVDETSA